MSVEIDWALNELEYASQSRNVTEKLDHLINALGHLCKVVDRIQEDVNDLT